MQDIPEIISERLYDRTSENYGMYKVIQYLGIKGKTNVPYFLIKFKDTGNEIEAPLKTILENRVIDIERKKKETKKK